MDACAWYAMRECFALSQRVPREQVDMKTLFPTGKDYTELFAQVQIPQHTTEELVAESQGKKKPAAIARETVAPVAAPAAPAAAEPAAEPAAAPAAEPAAASEGSESR